MAIRAADIIAPVLAATIVVVLFFASVASEASFGNLFGRFSGEGTNLGFIAAAVNVSFAGAVTGFATLTVCLPASVSELGVSGLRKANELVLVASLASLAAGEVCGRGISGGKGGRLLVVRIRGHRERALGQKQKPYCDQAGDSQNLNKFKSIHSTASFRFAQPIYNPLARTDMSVVTLDRDNHHNAHCRS